MSGAATVPVTLIVPTWNGGDAWRRVLAAITALDPRPEHVVVIDSSSTDGSADAARAAGFDVEVIDQREFDHGKTRMRGVMRARTELVAFLSQDALPRPDYLGHLVEALRDPSVGGATARILPHADSSPLARRTALASPLASAEPRVVSVEPEAFARATPAERRRSCLFDDVASLTRRALLIEHPFPRGDMGEDVAFAEQVLLAGMKLAFVPAAVVEHAHEYGPVTAFRRYRDDARFARRRFGVGVRRSILDVLRGIAHEVREDFRAARRESFGVRLRMVLFSPLLRGAQVIGQWWGSRAGMGGGAPA